MHHFEFVQLIRVPLYFLLTLCSFQVFDGNEDSDTVVLNKLTQPITARYIRLLPIEWHTHISMRIEPFAPAFFEFFEAVKSTASNTSCVLFSF